MDQKNTIVKCHQHDCLFNHNGKCDQYVIILDSNGYCESYIEAQEEQIQIEIIPDGTAPISIPRNCTTCQHCQYGAKTPYCLARETWIDSNNNDCDHYLAIGGLNI